jgi:hypothetical protein
MLTDTICPCCGEVSKKDLPKCFIKGGTLWKIYKYIPYCCDNCIIPIDNKENKVL